MQKRIAKLYEKKAFHPGRLQVDIGECREAMFLCLLQPAESCMHLNDWKKRIWQISEELLNHCGMAGSGRPACGRWYVL